MEAILAFGIVAFGAVALIAAGVVLDGYALSILWGWLVVPTFGVTQLGVVAAMGVTLVAHYLAHQYQPPAEKKQIGPSLAYIFARPLLFLLAGWIVKQYL